MHSETRPIFAFLILVVFGFFGWYYVQHTTRQVAPQRDETKPNIIAYKIVVRQFDQFGKLVDRISSPKLTHYEKNNVSYFESPDIDTQRNQEKPWHISAKQGKAWHGNEKIILWDDVYLHQARGPHNDENTVTTSRLNYYPARRYADTQAAVTMEQPGMVVHSIGLKAYLRQGKIELLSKTQGVYSEKQYRLHHDKKSRT